jgi:hypothetical protein
MANPRKDPEQPLADRTSAPQMGGTGQTPDVPPARGKGVSSGLQLGGSAPSNSGLAGTGQVGTPGGSTGPSGSSNSAEPSNTGAERGNMPGTSGMSGQETNESSPGGGRTISGESRR